MYDSYAPETRFSFFPPAIKHFMIINGLAFVALNTPFIGTFLSNNFTLFPMGTSRFEWHQLITYMFLHGSISHLLFNLIALWMFGAAIENLWGTARFTIFYFATGAGAALFHMLFSSSPVIGASGAVYGILLAFGMTFPNRIIMLLFPPIPIKAKYLVVIYGVIELFSGISGSESGVAHFAHLGGMLFGFVLIRLWRTGSRSSGIYD
jgi:membrane associated rhomboid family serine protease